MQQIEQKEHGGHGKFELVIDGQRAGEMDYKYDGKKVINIYKTEVDKQYEGKGYATDLLHKATDFARENKLMIIPECPFVEAKMKKDDRLKELIKPN